MKSTLLIGVVCLALVSCGPRRPGKVGAAGKDGTNGQDGFSLVVDVRTFVTEYGVLCKQTDIFQDLDRNNIYSTGDTYQNGFFTCDGAVGGQGIQGEKGDKGDQGDAGQDGADGVDGQDGADGLNADTTYNIVQVIDPCGQQHPQGYDEVILKLGNGKYLASFSDNANGLNTRFGLLKPGSYVTTDGTNCHFTIP